MKWSHSLTSWSHLQLQQELGLTWAPSKRRRIGSSTRFAGKIARLYSVRNDATINISRHIAAESQGFSCKAILDLTFSPCGDMVAAATENNSILLYDPLCHKLIHQVTSAHSQPVNCVTFLDDHLFATGSDDACVTLWDRRNIKSQVTILSRYQSAVKNLQYHSESRCLIVTTSDFDGSVYLCPILREETYQPMSPDNTLHLSCVTKCRLSRDGNKLIFATSEGYMMVIHDLMLTKLATDLAGFRPDLYRLMQCGNSCGFDFGSWYNYLFKSPRNRVELISDFPMHDEPHVITSVDVHPTTSTILSRNITRGDNDEWTCVHSIQDHMRPFKCMPILLPKDGIVHSYKKPPARGDTSVNESTHSIVPSSQFNSSPEQVTSNASYSTRVNEFTRMPMNTVVIISSRSLDQRAQATILTPNTSYRSVDPNKTPPRIFTNIPRLLYHIPEEKEHTFGRRYFKESGFSNDGRLICSPHRNGLRLLAFDQEVNEIHLPSTSQVKSNESRKLVELTHLKAHQDSVLVSKFSPTHHLITSACQSGRVVFSHPSLG